MSEILNLPGELIQAIPQKELIMSLALGVGLSASSGFRVFVPLLAASIAAKFGVLPLGPGFAWMGSTAALVAFGMATLVEIAGYYIPFIDHILDTITTPASVVAGTLLTTSVLTPDLDPTLKWGLGIIVGGGSAGVIQAGTALTRATSTVTTAGVGNPIVATIEHIFSVIGSILSILMPLIIAGIAVLIIVLFLFFITRYFKKHIPQTTS